MEGNNGHTKRTCPDSGPRDRPLQKHNLVDILPLCIIAMICGVENVENIVFFGETREDWLQKYPALPHGIPGAETI
jgi:hypothetical protein